MNKDVLGNLLLAVTVVGIALTSGFLMHYILATEAPSFDYTIEKNPVRKNYLIMRTCERKSRACYDRCVEAAWEEKP
jgi:hypothetical protein